MTAVSQSIFDDLVGEPCLECRPGTLERATTSDGTPAIVCRTCGQTRAVLWGVDQ